MLDVSNIVLQLFKMICMVIIKSVTGKGMKIAAYRKSKNRKYVPDHTVRVREVGGSNPLTPTQVCTALLEGGVSFKDTKRAFKGNTE